MITVYSMKTCPDCTRAEEQIAGNKNYQIVDIGEDVRDMKKFIRLRDSSPAFDEAKKNGSIGIPCFILEDGTVTLNPEDAGLSASHEKTFCSIDGKGC